MNILFSPIGGTDPISNFRDGAMLHISRHYKPDKVYLYLSSEMCAFHDRDNRYIYCLEHLGEKMGHSFSWEIIRRENMHNVQIYDIFVEEFRKICYSILKEEKVDKLYVNISSGTPAMKSALLILSILSNGRLIPIQVSTPQKRMNPHAENREHYEVEEYWDLNEDNLEGMENRCTIADSLSWLWEIKKEIIEKHILAYDYVAALQILEGTEHTPGSKIYRLIKAADCRLKLNFAGMKKLLNGYNATFLPMSEEEDCNLMEYTLGVQIRQKKKEYADFVRALSPLLLDLYYVILYQECNLDVKKELCKKMDANTKKERYVWDMEKIKKNARVEQALSRKYRNGFFGKDVGNNHLNGLIQALCKDSDVIKRIKVLERVETQIRNLAAHEIVSVTDKEIKETTGVDSKEILNTIKWFMEAYILKGQYKGIWDSYDNMNEHIIKVIKTGDI